MYFLEKGMCQEDNKPGQAARGWIIHTEEGRIECPSRLDCGGTTPKSIKAMRSIDNTAPLS